MQHLEDQLSVCCAGLNDQSNMYSYPLHHAWSLSSFLTILLHRPFRYPLTEVSE